jgi:hypothetical protein
MATLGSIGAKKVSKQKKINFFQKRKISALRRNDLPAFKYYNKELKKLGV